MSYDNNFLIKFLNNINVNSFKKYIQFGKKYVGKFIFLLFFDGKELRGINIVCFYKLC